MTKHNVLVPLDGSEFSREIIPYVRQFLPVDENVLILLRVARPPRGLTGLPPRPVAIDGWQLPMYESEQDVVYAKHPIFSSQEMESIQADLTNELQPVVQQLQEAGYDVSVAVRFGEPAAEIVSFVANEKIDLVTLATHGRTGVSRLVLGSVAEHVVRHAPAPVLLVRPFERPHEELTAGERLITRFQEHEPLRITAATDGSPFSQAAIIFAGELARTIDAHLTMIVAVSEEEGAVHGREILDETWELVGDVEPRPESVPLVGYKDEVILRHLDEDPADLLIVSAFGDRDTTAPTALGLTTQRLVQTAPCSVLVVKGARSATYSFDNMLVSTAVGDEAVVEAAVRLAKATGAKLRVLHVIPPEAARYITEVDTPDIPIADVLVQETPLAHYLQKVVRLLESQGFGEEVLFVRSGPVADTILQESQRDAYDLVIVGSQSGPGYFLGSVANHIVKYADRPILVVRMTT